MANYMIGIVRKYKNLYAIDKDLDIIGIDVISTSNNKVKFYTFKELKDKTDKGLKIRNIEITDSGIKLIETGLKDYRCRIVKDNESIKRVINNVLLLERLDGENQFMGIDLSSNAGLERFSSSDLAVYKHNMSYNIINNIVKNDKQELEDIDLDKILTGYCELDRNIKNYMDKISLLGKDFLEITKIGDRVTGTILLETVRSRRITDLIIPTGVTDLCVDRGSLMELGFDIKYLEIPSTVTVVAGQLFGVGRIEKIKVSIGKGGLKCRSGITMNGECDILEINTEKNELDPNLFINLTIKEKLKINKPLKSISNNSFNVTGKAADLSGLTINKLGNNNFRFIDNSAGLKLPKGLQELTSYSLNYYINSREKCQFTVEKLEIPKSVKFIESLAVRLPIEKLLIGHKIELGSLENGPFYGSIIKQLEITGGLLSVESFSFVGNAIEKLTLYDGIRTIGEFAFNECKLEKLSIPSSVRYIKSYSFDSNKLDTLTFDDGCKAVISKGAFTNNNLKSVVIRKGMTVDSGAFDSNVKIIYEK